MKRVLIFCALLSFAQCANILFVTSFPSHSHQVMFQPVWKELSLRGHNVIAITPNPLRDESLTNLTEVDISKLYEKIQVSLVINLLINLVLKRQFVSRRHVKMKTQNSGDII